MSFYNNTITEGKAVTKTFTFSMQQESSDYKVVKDVNLRSSYNNGVSWLDVIEDFVDFLNSCGYVIDKEEFSTFLHESL